MKRETRKTLVQVERMNDATLRADQARDALASDARQAAELRRLRKAMKRIHDLTKPQTLAQLPRDTARICWDVDALVAAALKPARRKP